MNDRHRDMAMIWRIRQEREAKGISQRVLAKMSGVSEHVIKKVENYITRLRATDMVKMADALGLSLDYIAHGEKEEENNG